MRYVVVHGAGINNDNTIPGIGKTRADAGI